MKCNEEYVLPCVDKTRLVYCSPTKVFDPRYIGCLFIKLFHTLECEAFKCLAVSTSIREQFQHRDELWQAVLSNRMQKVVCKRTAAMWGGDGRHGKYGKFAVREMAGQVSAIQAALIKPCMSTGREKTH